MSPLIYLTVDKHFHLHVNGYLDMRNKYISTMSICRESTQCVARVTSISTYGADLTTQKRLMLAL